MRAVGQTSLRCRRAAVIDQKSDEVAERGISHRVVEVSALTAAFDQSCRGQSVQVERQSGRRKLERLGDGACMDTVEAGRDQPAQDAEPRLMAQSLKCDSGLF